MRAEIKRERLEGGGYGEYIDLHITAKSLQQLNRMEQALIEMGYQEAIEKIDDSKLDGGITYYFSVNTFDVPTVEEVMRDYKEAKSLMKEESL